MSKASKGKRDPLPGGGGGKTVASDEPFSLLFNPIPVPSLVTHPENGRIIAANDAAVSMFGYTRDEMLGKTTVELGIWYSPEERKKYLSRFIADGFVREAETKVKSKSGQVLDVLFNTEKIFIFDKDQILTVYYDITGRRNAEDTLRMREQSYRTLAENLPGIVYRVHAGENGRMQFFNNMLVAMTGYNEHELTKGEVCSIDPLIVAQDRERVIAEVEAAVAENRTFLVEYRITHKDGSIRSFSERGRPIHDETGHLFIDGIIQDITDRTLMEAEIRSLNRSLEQRVAERTGQLNASLEEQTVMLREIHHRVKNNLQILISLLNLQSRAEPDGNIRAALKETQNRIRAMALVHEKLYQSENISIVHLADYLGFLGSGIISSVGVTRNISLDIQANGISLDLNAAIPVGLIVNELVSNAVRHAFFERTGGVISITVSRDGDNLNLVVSDNGRGIPVPVNWKNPPSIGLRLVNILVEQLHGTIELDRNNGTSFSIVFKEHR